MMKLQNNQTIASLCRKSNLVAKIVALLLCSFVALPSLAQVVEGTSYYLPKTAMRFTLLVEKTVFAPGEMCGYAQRYLKKSVGQEPATTYRLLSTTMNTFAVPDTAKRHTLIMDRRLSISNVERTDDGILLAINARPSSLPEPAHFVAKPKAAPLNARDYMNEDILTAGSTAKMAALIAQEIYDIRDSRNQLQRGQAEFMPTDGQQLRIMMEGLDRQERALRQMFEGTTTIDTTEVVVEYVPTKVVDRELLFRFSRYFGLVDADDLSGEPYYVSVALDQPFAEEAAADAQKKQKDDIGLWVNTPARIKVKLIRGTQPLYSYDFNAGQFGRTEVLSGALFGRKQTCRIVLNPLTGGIESIKEDNLEH